jgi:glyoxylase-like metal-dependent hydrolase (beta-lactamase superfamily II)
MEVAPRIHLLRAFGCQVFALLDDAGVTLIDAGSPGSAPLVLRQLRSLGVQPRDVTRIVLTHYHVDHRGAAESLRRATSATVLIHEIEAPFLRGELPYPNPVRAPFRAMLTAPLMAAMRGRPIPVETLEEGEMLEVLGGLRVIHTPGHTPGSIALALPALGILFSGDTMGFSRRRLEEPVPLLCEDTTAARGSIERLARLDVETICFSHFPPLRRGARGALQTLVRTWAGEEAR